MDSIQQNFEFHSMLPGVYASLLACMVCVVLIIASTRKEGKNVPPGTLGLPVIGETLEFLRAQKSNKTHEWIQHKVSKYGPVFKTSLMGSPTVVLTGQQGNRFLLANDYNSVVNKQPATVSAIVGSKNLFELPMEEHKRMRGAIMRFLNPQALHTFVGRMESVILQHMEDCWQGKEIVTVWPLMKTLTFQLACDLIFGLTDGEEREILVKEFDSVLKGVWSLPFNLPGTNFHKGICARGRLWKRLSSLMDRRRKDIRDGKAFPGQDLMSCMLTLRDEKDEGLTDEEIIDNMIVLMIASHDTTSVLLTHLIRMLSLHPNIHQNLLREHEEIVAGKPPNEGLKSEDIQNMKYTWKVAQETLRLIPPVFGAFRKAIKDVEYGGYTIPQGWQLFWTTSSTHRSEEIFLEAEKFDPSHFDSKIPPYTFIAFGGGHRLCPGYEFAKMETSIFLHHLVSKYKWSLLAPDETITCEPIFPVPSMGLPIKLQLQQN